MSEQQVFDKYEILGYIQRDLPKGRCVVYDHDREEYFFTNISELKRIIDSFDTDDYMDFVLFKIKNEDGDYYVTKEVSSQLL